MDPQSSFNAAPFARKACTLMACPCLRLTRYSFLGTSDSAADLMRQFGADQGQPREPPEPPPGAPVFRPPVVASDGLGGGLSPLGRPSSIALSAPLGGERCTSPQYAGMPIRPSFGRLQFWAFLPSRAVPKSAKALTESATWTSWLQARRHSQQEYLCVWRQKLPRFCPFACKGYVHPYVTGPSSAVCAQPAAAPGASRVSGRRRGPGTGTRTSRGTARRPPAATATLPACTRRSACTRRATSTPTRPWCGLDFRAQSRMGRVRWKCCAFHLKTTQAY